MSLQEAKSLFNKTACQRPQLSFLPLTSSLKQGCDCPSSTNQEIPRQKQMNPKKSSGILHHKRNTRAILNDFNKAAFKFVKSQLAVPFLNLIFDTEKKKGGDDESSLSGLMRFLRQTTFSENCCRHSSSIYTISHGDTEEERRYKKILQSMVKVFLESFSVQWILCSKVQNKGDYLKIRRKMLNRVKK